MDEILAAMKRNDDTNGRYFKFHALSACCAAGRPTYMQLRMNGLL